MNDTPNVPAKMKASDISVASQGVNFGNAGDMMAFANMMAQSLQAVPKSFRNAPGMCLKLVDDSIRFGMSPFALASGAYVVNDQVAYEAKVLSAIILGRAPIQDRPDYEFTGEGKARSCTVIFKTLNGKTIKHSSPKLEDITPQNSPLWKSDPDQQLSYYTIRAASRRHFPDILMGVYDMEEAAVARMTVINPESSGLVGRLSKGNAGDGFDPKQVDQELKTTEEKVEEDTNPDATVLVEEIEASEIDAGEIEKDQTITLLKVSLLAATTQNEVHVISDDVSETLKYLDQEDQETAKGLIEERMAELKKKK